MEIKGNNIVKYSLTGRDEQVDVKFALRGFPEPTSQGWACQTNQHQSVDEQGYNNILHLHYCFLILALKDASTALSLSNSIGHAKILFTWSSLIQLACQQES
jgi:hypothetical protein